MAIDGKPVALVALIHPKSVEKKNKVLQLAASSLDSFFRRPSTQCTTACTFQPATRKGAMLGMVPADEKATMLGRVEILSSAAAVQALEAASEIKTWDSTMAREELLAQADEVTMWYPTAGFVARKGEKETGKASIGMLAKFICKDGEGMRDKLVDVLGRFCDWVEANEPTTLTYCVMTRPEAPNEVMLFERYKDLPALGVHGKSNEFKAMFKGTGPFVQGRKTVLSEWEELQGSFVSNVPGGAGLGGGQAKL